ncbi:inactive serine/threonine-protein kinase 19 isoform X2 [Ambystoma mexicanum]|uniref:inactive serine/threonine-protein kinase 19 isoform X2 n=1 Tax=Ambystoma mexicanum TaxID=8296 RepID=UPI0037E9490B
MKTMDRKRKFICDTFKVKKRRAEPVANFQGEDNVANTTLPAKVQDTRAALQYLVSIFPRRLFEDSMPPVVLKHQLYSLVQDRTAVDRQLSDMKEQGEIRMFQHGFDTDVFGVVFTEDYTTRVRAATEGKAGATAVHKFLEKVLTTCSDISVGKEKMLLQHSFQDREISQLVHAGVLTVRDAGSWWLAIPGAGRFVKYFMNGRKTLLGTIRKTKYKEVLLQDLHCRKVPPNVKLGLQYHIYDIIGADLVDCIPTTSGTLLRLADT